MNSPTSLAPRQRPDTTGFKSIFIVLGIAMAFAITNIIIVGWRFFGQPNPHDLDPYRAIVIEKFSTPGFKATRGDITLYVYPQNDLRVSNRFGTAMIWLPDSGWWSYKVGDTIRLNYPIWMYGSFEMD